MVIPSLGLTYSFEYRKYNVKNGIFRHVGELVSLSGDRKP